MADPETADMAVPVESNENMEGSEESVEIPFEESVGDITTSDVSTVHTEGSATEAVPAVPIMDQEITEPPVAEEETKEVEKEEAPLAMSQEPTSVRPSVPLVDTQMDDDEDDVAAKAAVTLAGE